MIHVYAFTEELDEPPESEGVDGAPLECLSVDGVTAIFSRRRGTSSAETLRDDALAHGAVVESLMERGRAVVPVRFGEVLLDDAALGASLRARVDSLRDVFGRVRGCVEVSLRVWDADAPAAATAATGTDYMRLRLAEETRRRAAAETLHRRLADVSRAARVQEGAAEGRQRFAGAYLVQEERLHEARRAVDEFAAAHPELTVVCTGPWPPFNFVTGEVAA